MVINNGYKIFNNLDKDWLILNWYWLNILLLPTAEGIFDLAVTSAEIIQHQVSIWLLHEIWWIIIYYNFREDIINCDVIPEFCDGLEIDMGHTLFNSS